MLPPALDSCPDTGRERPQFFRLRQPFLTVKIVNYDPILLTSDGASIHYNNGSPLLKVGDWTLRFCSVDSIAEIGVSWYRSSRSYWWYGLEISEEAKLLLNQFVPVSDWLFTKKLMDEDKIPSFIYLHYGEKTPVNYSDLDKILNSAHNDTLQGSLSFGLCHSDSYMYWNDIRKWGNGHESITETKMLNRLRRAKRYHDSLYSKYENALAKINSIIGSTVITPQYAQYV